MKYIWVCILFAILSGPLLKAQTAPGNIPAQTYYFTVTDTNGISDIVDVYILFASTAVPNGTPYGIIPNACYIEYIQSGNQVYLTNDSGSAQLGPITVGSSSVLSNSQCSITGSNITVTSSGNSLIIEVVYTFFPSFSGARSAQLQVVQTTPFYLGHNYSGWFMGGTQVVPNAIANTAVVKAEATGGGGGSGVVGSGTIGQYAYYSSTGTTVSGRNIVKADLPSSLVYNNQINTYGNFLQDFSGSNGLKLPQSTTILGGLSYSNSSPFAVLANLNNSIYVLPGIVLGTPPTVGNCVKWLANYTLGDQGSACGSGGGSYTFNVPLNNVSNTVSLLYGTVGGLGTVGGGADIETSVVPTLAGANLYTGSNDFTGASAIKPLTRGSTAPPCAVSSDEGNFWLDTTSSTANHLKVCATVSSTLGFQTIF